MNQLDALRLMVRNYPGGIAAAAARLDKKPSTLEKELGNSPDHKLGVLDACAISAMCIELNTPHCRAYAMSVASECGGFVQLEVREMAPAVDACMPRRPGPCAVGTVQECAQLLTAVSDALADGKISANELKRIEREAMDLTDQAQQVVRDARAMHLTSIPASERGQA